MIGLDAATTVARVADGRYRADLSAEWEIWGPQGGYLASVALRTVGLHCARARPATIGVHFVGAGSSGEVDIEVVTERSTRVGTSVSFRLRQRNERGDRVILTGTAWGVDADLPGLEHAPKPPVDPFSPADLPNVQELVAGRDVPPPHPFWLNVETRPLDWIDDWDTRPARPARQRNWYRFVEGQTFDDPWLDACRSLVVLDVDSWGAATRPHVGDLEHFAPTIELAARFVGDASNEPWLLSDARAPVASGGLVAHEGDVWAADGRLVTTGGSTLLCRPAARRPDGR